MQRHRLIVGISGASAPAYGVRLLELLKDVKTVETHFVYTRAAVRTIEIETRLNIDQIRCLADFSYAPDDFAAPISSGSFRTAGMIVAPCSVSTLSSIAASITKDLLTRAADVMLKERRPLVLLFRESPFHLGHLRTMTKLTEMGAIIAPPIPAFYHRPQGLDDLINHAVGRAVELAGLEAPWLERWGG